jgi:hypothetical protein
MKKYLTALILAGGFAAAQSHAACDYPVAPGKFPDGSQASKEEMLAAKKLVTQYNTDMEGYLACIKTEFDAKAAADTSSTAAQKAEAQKVQDRHRRDGSLQRTAARVESQERAGEEELLIGSARVARKWRYVSPDTRPG